MNKTSIDSKIILSIRLNKMYVIVYVYVFVHRMQLKHVARYVGSYR